MLSSCCCNVLLPYHITALYLQYLSLLGTRDDGYSLPDDDDDVDDFSSTSDDGSSLTQNQGVSLEENDSVSDDDNYDCWRVLPMRAKLFGGLEQVVHDFGLRHRWTHSFLGNQNRRKLCMYLNMHVPKLGVVHAIQTFVCGETTHCISWIEKRIVAHEHVTEHYISVGLVAVSTAFCRPRE